VLSQGTVLDGRYEIVAPLGSGGMGHVYRAKRPLLGDEVAIKVMHASFDSPSDAKHRFLRESRACARLRHPNIVTILDFNVDPLGQPYMVMELLSGPSLREELALGGPMTPAAAVALLAPVAAALQLAHDHGITHRDLKPANIMSHRYDSGERVYKVIDFGLASVKEATDGARLTAPNLFIGTIAYAAPEQLKGEAVDARTDIYTLGAIAYEMLTGHRPFDADNRTTLVNQTLTATPVEPRRKRPDLPARVDEVVLRALAKNRDERWSSVNEFVGELRAATESASVATKSPASDATLLSKYQLGELIGPGRLGSQVYRGTHRALGVPVAVRILRRESQPNWAAVRARFLLEGQTLQVSHPNLLQVRDFGEDERLVYLVTDYVEGSSLREELERVRSFPWPRVASLLKQMLDAVNSLNPHGGFITGVNPDMIRLSRDGGHDRLVMSTAGIRSVQDVLATMNEQQLRGAANDRELPYVAPEVLLGRAPECTADVFTTAVLAYEMATSQLPYTAPSLPQLIGQMLHANPASPRALRPEIPENASIAILRALAPDPSARFPDVAEFARALGL